MGVAVAVGGFGASGRASLGDGMAALAGGGLASVAEVGAPGGLPGYPPAFGSLFCGRFIGLTFPHSAASHLPLPSTAI